MWYYIIGKNYKYEALKEKSFRAFVMTLFEGGVSCQENLKDHVRIKAARISLRAGFANSIKNKRTDATKNTVVPTTLTNVTAERGNESVTLT